MATVNTRSRRRMVRVPQETSDAQPRRRRKLLVMVPLVVIAGLWLAPMIVARPTILNRLAAFALSDINGTVHIRSASLDWFSPVHVSGIEIRDALGEPVVTVLGFSSEKSLLGLLLNRADIGQLRIDQPELHVAIHDGTTNVEETFAAWLTPLDEDSDDEDDEEKVAASTAANVTVDHGIVFIRDGKSGRQGQICDLMAAIKLATHEPLTIDAQGVLKADGESGTFSVSGVVPMANETAQRAGDGQLDAHLAGVPLSLAGLLAQRAAPGTEVSGRLTALLSYHWSLASGSQARLEADVATRQLVLAGPWLNGDRLELTDLTMPCRASITDDRLDVEQLGVTCDLGNLSFNGIVPLGGEGWQAALESETLALEGDIDLVRLATALPNTIHVRDDTQITTGRLQFALHRRRQDQQYVIDGQLQTDRLAAVHAGQEITWDEPLSATLAARDTGSGIEVDRLQCQSSFLSIEGSGTLDRFSAQGNFDLDRLVAELERFIDLGDLELAGSGNMTADVQRDASREVSAQGTLAIRQLVLATGQGPTWRDEQLNVRVDAKALVHDWKCQRLDEGHLHVDAGNDRLFVELAQPVEFDDAGPLWSLVCQLGGRLETWQPRLRPFVPSLASYQLAGQCDLTAHATQATELLEISDARLQLQNCVIAGDGITINEPRIDVAGTLRAAGNMNRIDLTNVSMTCAALALNTSDFVIQQHEEGLPSAAGQIHWKGDLHRLNEWFADPAQSSDMQLWGAMEGTLAVDSAGQQTETDLKATIRQLVAVWSDGTQWREPEVRLTAQTDYTANDDRMQIHRLELASAAISASAAGSVAEASARRQVDLKGQLKYDLANLDGLIRMLTGATVRVQGRGERPFTVRGPVGSGVDVQVASATNVQPQDDASWLEEITATGGVDWRQIEAYGFVVGPGQIDARLEQGILNVAPLDVAVSGGRLKAAPRVRMAPGPAELTLQRGKLIDRVEITQAMCQRGLKYVAPALAGVARASGKFSVDLDHCVVPLSTPEQGDVGGRLAIHTIEISGGPLIQELATILNRPASVQLARQSQVSFRMVGGRVHHQGMQLVFPDTTIRTSGSVGLDGSLALVAEMPVPDKWIGNNPLGDAIKNKVIQLPISGTLEHPKVDRRALAQLNAQAVQESAVDAVRGELNKQINNGLNRLFNPR